MTARASGRARNGAGERPALIGWLRGSVALCAVLAAQSAAAQGAPPAVGRGVIAGTITDTSLRAIPGVDVTVVGTGSRLTADSAGRFSILEVPRGEFLVWVRRLGYRPISTVVRVDPGDTLRLAFTLEPTVTDLAAVVVTEKARSPKMREFDERRQAGFGQFLTQAEIETLNFIGLEGVLRTFKSVRVEPKTRGYGYVIASTRMSACPMQAYVDGIPRGNDLDDLPSPKEVAGIEVYPGPATTPLHLLTGNTGKRFCGVILIWTRDGS